MRFLLTLFLLIISASPAFAEDGKTLKIYHDADWMNSEESSEAIWRGMEVALSEIGHEVNGARIELIKKNHSANVTRSLRNMKAFLGDEQAIAMFSGMHSPPLLTHRKFINDNNIPFLVPWAAGGPITRYPSNKNSIFRLSVDDSKAGGVMVQHAVTSHQCSKPYLLLENTSWGDTNARSIKKALDQRGVSAVGMKRFDWSMKSHVARSIILGVIREQAECIIVVSNVGEGAQIALAMSELEENARLPIISHWGITGGNFHGLVNASAREKIDLHFIQTCFSFMNQPLKPFPKTVFNNLKTLFPEQVETVGDIKSPAGFIHAYDLMKIFTAALETVELTDDIQADRERLRVALESLNVPVQGLIKEYRSPFSKFSDVNDDAHEALNSSDICMAEYNSDNIITLTSDGSE